jgi:hypothetical protein
MLQLIEEQIQAWTAAEKAFQATGGKRARLAICATCEHFQSALVRCDKCHCFLKIKAAIHSFHCPLAKW